MVANAPKKVDVTKQGLEKVKSKNKVVYLNLAGKSETMEKKGWVDPQGRKGKVRVLFCSDCLFVLIHFYISQQHVSRFVTPVCFPSAPRAGLWRVQVREQVRDQRGRLLPNLYP